MNALWEDMKAYARIHNVPILRDAELPLFRRLIMTANPVSVLEIGTAIGYSTLQIAACLGKNSHITTIEIDAERIAAARHFISRSPYASAIRLIEGDGTALIGKLPETWDFVFLDGPKGQYSRQLRSIMPHLRPRALIVADNVRYHDMVYIDGVVPHKHRTAVERLHEFMRLISDADHFESVFFENGDGMTVSRWKG